MTHSLSGLSGKNIVLTPGNLATFTTTSGEVYSKVTGFFTKFLALRVDEAMRSKQSQAVLGHNGNNSHPLGRKKERTNDNLQNAYCQMCPR